ncbi:SseB family protein [Amycolatopsis roodepoortensis]|uniref:SseB family protein n=1 Tax=Amycolatopsis roodepoortensis TaxID=700274 RepID=UPI00214A98A6|nr:SseB family protein [Amycolatopsis roodepoortensis]UUV32265.1 SseB family protein [Amycolatopsis roodepoortensis]
MTVARQVKAGLRSPGDVMAVFATSTVYARRPRRTALLVTELGDRGRWTVVFSSLDRLAVHAGECDYLSTTGDDFMELVPEGVAVMLDPDDGHRFPVLSKAAPADFVARMRIGKPRG